METMGDRLKRAREKLFPSARQAAIANGWRESTVRSHENAGKKRPGSRGFGRNIEEATAIAKKYARAYGVDYRSILYEGFAAKGIPPEVDARAQRLGKLDDDDWVILDPIIERLVADKNPR